MIRRLKDALKDGSPYWLFALVFYAYELGWLLPRSWWNRRKSGLPPLAATDLAHWKTSDTLFVLGSGTSINRIPPEHWEAIRRADSLGLNRWIFHAFVPTMLLYESSAPGTDGAQAEHAWRLRRAEAYRKTLKIVTDFYGLPSVEHFGFSEAWKQNQFVAHTLLTFARSNEEFARSVRLLAAFGAFRPQRRVSRLFKHCGTLSTAITLAVKMGYRRVVLCGIDLTDSYYYFHDEKLYPDVPRLGLAEAKEVHPTMTRFAWGNTPIDTVLAELQRQVLAPAGIELYVQHERSALYPRIPLAPPALYAELRERPAPALYALAERAR